MREIVMEAYVSGPISATRVGGDIFINIGGEGSIQLSWQRAEELVHAINRCFTNNEVNQ